MKVDVRSLRDPGPEVVLTSRGFPQRAVRWGHCWQIGTAAYWVAPFRTGVCQTRRAAYSPPLQHFTVMARQSQGRRPLARIADPHGRRRRLARRLERHRAGRSCRRWRLMRSLAGQALGLRRRPSSCRPRRPRSPCPPPAVLAFVSRPCARPEPAVRGTHPVEPAHRRCRRAGRGRGQRTGPEIQGCMTAISAASVRTSDLGFARSAVS